MADFEALIRSALAKQNSGDANVRGKVYQSSRNALNKMITANRGLTVEGALTQQKALEDAIGRIEAEYTAPMNPAPVRDPAPTPDRAPEVATVEPPVPPQQTAPAGEGSQARAFPEDASVQPTLEDFEAVREPEDGDRIEAMDSFRQMPPEFTRRRKSQKRFLVLIVIFVILLLIAWFVYQAYGNFMGGSLFGDTGGGITSLDPNSGQNRDSDYITILEPGDPTPLVTAGRGRAEIVNELNSEMLRIVSVRDDADRLQAAKPIQLKISPGVLQEISGRKITFEIFAKSGGTGPATFSVECMFGELGKCGRKRFRVGLQPEAVVFSADLNRIDTTGVNAYLAINTDITSTSETTGLGDLVDIVYARVRIGE